MKVIFSRKGFDGTAGGCPSPIVDGECISLPIPTKMPTATKFSDLHGPYGDLVADLTGGKIGRDRTCHLDPDLAPDTIPRLPAWRGALGQVAAAQGHLKKHAVAAGDLFLFWGVFRHAYHRNGRWKFVGQSEHRIFGWLQIGQIIELGKDGSHALTDNPWLRDHPHVRNGWSDSNTLYIAASNTSIGDTALPLPGAGRIHSGYRLTVEQDSPGHRPSLWNAPRWLNPLHGGAGMTYHGNAERWTENALQVAARGQEFVADVGSREDAFVWVRDILGARL